MVLSNKKLKQKLREAISESLRASEEAKSTNPDPNSQTRESLKALLEPAALKSKLRRREKRRETLALKSLNSETLDLETLNLESGEKNGGSESLIEKGERKKEKKRKREDRVKSENVGLGEKKLSNKKKKKKYKKKSSEKEKNSEKSENGASEEIDRIEPNHTSDGQDTGEVATKVYVGGIPYYSTEDDIRSYFESCGTITEIDCLMFPDSGKFRGIAIISFKTDAAAKRALALDGSDMGGLFLKIVPYKSTKAKKHTEDFAPSIVEGYNRIYVGNLSWDITEDDLKKFFAGCKISSIRFGEDKETKEFKGYAHVDFADSLSLNMALKLDQEMVCGRPARVRCAVPAKKNIIIGNTAKVDESKEVVAEKDTADVAVVAAVAEEVSGKIRRRTCYECGEKGHLSSSCPKKKAAAEEKGNET